MAEAEAAKVGVRVTAGLDILDEAIMAVMADRDEEWCYPFAYLCRHTGLSRDMVRAVCRSLTERGLAYYSSALTTYDGEMAGAGYGLTDAGRNHFKKKVAFGQWEPVHIMER